MTLVEIDTNAVVIDNVTFPDQNNDIILDHFVYYCEKTQWVPAIIVRIADGKIVVSQGHKHLFAAKHIGQKTIQAFLALDASQKERSMLLAHPCVILKDAEEVRRSLKPVIKQWHIFYFDRDLENNSCGAFRSMIVDFFNSVESHLLVNFPPPRTDNIKFDSALHRAEFSAITAVGDERWFSAFYSRAKDFSNNIVRIVSYNGRMFE